MRELHRVAGPYDDDDLSLLQNPPWGYARGRPVEHRCQRGASHSSSRTAAQPSREGKNMELRVERDALVDAVGWTARSLPTRPPMQVLLGLLLESTESGLPVSGFDYEVSSQITVDAGVAEAGRVLVP